MNQPPRSKVYIEGRYRKLCRDLPQTVFFCPDCKGHPRRRKGCERCEGFGKLTRDSVQELVSWVLCKAFRTRRNKFHGAGREDVDVRMLGEGRPFVLELIGPKEFDVDLASLEEEINRRNAGRLELEGLHWTDKSRVRILKETHHAKRYAAVVRTAAEVDPSRVEPLLGRRVTVLQSTPQRVAHRRAQKERERWVQLDRFEPLEPAGEDGSPRYALELTTEHGTYVKEVLSGESGRTRPSFSELLGTPVECVELDVLAILDEEGQEAAAPDVAPRFGAGL